MGAYHALLSPSGAFRWTSCTASPAAQVGKPNESREASRMGTCGHQIGEELLLNAERDPQTYLGRTMAFLPNGHSDWIENIGSQTVVHTHVVDEALLDAAMIYVNFVRQQVELLGADLLVEQAVPIGRITGEKDATGSSDAILISNGVLTVIDAKFGRGKVYAYDVIEPESFDILTGEVVPPKYRMNLQAAMYALGAYEKVSLLAEFTKVKAIIVQPFLGSISEYECSLDELLALGKWLSERASLTTANPEFVPNSKNCFFCRARFDCHARNAEALKSAVEGFEDEAEFKEAKTLPVFLPSVGQLYSKVEMIRQWCDDIESKVHAELSAGSAVLDIHGKPMKLVEGRKPHKRWADEAEAIAAMEKMRFKEMWVKSLITPAQAVAYMPKKAKKGEEPPPSVLGKTQAKKLLEMVTQDNGKPVIAFSTDPRPALPTSTGMDDLPADNSDLF